MLKSMYVKNFAIIDNIQIEFKDKMTVLTGETGAGKSLIIDAIGLLFGDRASSDLVRKGENKATVEGIFTNTTETDAFLKDNEIDLDDFLIIKREIYENGKSVCKINNEAVSLNLLNELGLMLGSIHTQFDNEKLTNPKNYFDFVDTDIVKERLVTYSNLLKEYNKKNKEYQTLLKNELENNQKLDFLKYQFDELKKANLSAKEEEDLKEQLNLLNNYEKISSNVGEFVETFDNNNILDNIYSSINYLEKAGEYNNRIKEYKELLEDSYYDILDTYESVKQTISKLDFNQNEFDEINDRLGVYSNLKRKYKLNTVELVDYYNNLEKQINSIENFDYIKEELEKEVTKLKKDVLDVALEISQERISQAKFIEKEIKTNLDDLQLASTLLEINVVSNKDNFKKNGIDDIEINITFNKGEDLKPLYKVASGGELSRFMLALKAISSNKFKNKTLIFDEIDSGVSGLVAYSIAKKIKEIGEYAQVLCVTHLAQVASSATTQLNITKQVENGRTITKIKELSIDERISEISKMASFGEETEASINFAKELLKQK